MSVYVTIELVSFVNFNANRTGTPHISILIVTGHLTLSTNNVVFSKKNCQFIVGNNAQHNFLIIIK